jgi:hypothetical protein
LDFLEKEIPKVDIDNTVVCEVKTKMNVELSQLKIHLPKYHREGVIGFEIGDDRADMSPSPERLALGIAAQEVIFLMKTSRNDTFISRNLYNLCEVTSCIPCSPGQSFDIARKTGDFSFLGFTDYAKLRICTDVSKDQTDHSSSRDGKVSMLSKECTTHNDHRFSFNLAHLLQDSFLETWRTDKPKYLPRYMGGHGASPLFGDWRNTYLYILGFRREKGNLLLYGTILKEIQKHLHNAERGIPSSSPVTNLLKAGSDLKREVNSLSEIFREKSNNKLILEEKGIYPILENALSSRGNQIVIGRLENARVLLTEENAVIRVSSYYKMREALFCTAPVGVSQSMQKDTAMVVRSAYGGAKKASTAFTNLLKGTESPKERGELLSQLGIAAEEVNLHVLNKKDVREICLGIKLDTVDARDLITSNNYYLAEDLPDPANFKVSGIDLLIQDSEKLRLSTTTTKVGLYQISGKQLDWVHSTVDQLKARRDQLKSPLQPCDATPILLSNLEWVNDDTGLITLSIRFVVEGECGPSSTICLVSDDVKLAKTISQETRLGVILLRAETMAYFALESGTFDPEKTPSWKEISKVVEDLAPEIREPVKIFFDTGSIMAQLAKMQIETCGISGSQKLYEIQTCSISNNGPSGRLWSYKRRHRPPVYRYSYIRYK